MKRKKVFSYGKRPNHSTHTAMHNGAGHDYYFNHHQLNIYFKVDTQVVYLERMCYFLFLNTYHFLDLPLANARGNLILLKMWRCLI